jgi:hypothetical protein
METISQGVEGINTVHTFMISEINSISGILYFLVKLLILAFLTSFKCFQKNRVQGFVILFINIFAEVALPHWILVFLGVKTTRIIFVLGHFMNLFKAFLSRENHFEDLRNEINGRLNTRRIKRIFREIMDEAKHPALAN